MVHRGETSEEDEKKESAEARKPFLRPLQSSPHHICEGRPNPPSSGTVVHGTVHFTKVSC